MLNFLQRFGIFCFLDNHQYDFNTSYECIAGAGMLHAVRANEMNHLHTVDTFKKKYDDWIFGHLSYDVKNQIEELQSAHPDSIQFPDFFFFVPEIVFVFNETQLKIGVVNHKQEADEIFTSIISLPVEIPDKNTKPADLQSRFTKEEYITTVEQLRQHIWKGDCYEINFCQEFYLENTRINPLEVYKQLSILSPNPFSAFYKVDDQYLICASPERFLKKSGDTIISQPMKGTGKRFINDAEDKKAGKQLSSNEKERSENIMIVDLVRNDLAKICEEGSVWVKEFLSVYSFPHVHQMISTIEGKLKKGISLSEIFLATFPMGSMTGAPKKRVMELIEKYERTRRGLFSGTIGYMSPGGDFDFNVVIRSILYNAKTGYVSIQAGSAITFKSVPETEYQECLIKIEAIKKALAG